MATTHTLAAELVMRCFNLRTAAHVAHLKTNSYAQHMALKDLYTGIIDVVDTFAEAYQGDYGIIDTYPAPQAKSGEVLGQMMELSTWLVSNREKIGSTDDTHLHNILDELLALLASTRYKLRFLR